MARSACRPLVCDESTGLVGELMDEDNWLCPRTGISRRVAYVRPEGGGCEWVVDAARLRYLDPVSDEDRSQVQQASRVREPADERQLSCRHLETVQRSGKTHCAGCLRQIYL